jgi:hypothetical protein
MALELLTIEELAKRLKISRATACEWQRQGIFRQGVHYLKFGRVVRYVWSDELIAVLLQDSAGIMPTDSQEEPTQTTPARKKAGAINWDY